MCLQSVFAKESDETVRAMLLDLKLLRCYVLAGDVRRTDFGVCGNWASIGGPHTSDGRILFYRAVAACSHSWDHPLNTGDPAYPLRRAKDGMWEGALLDARIDLIDHLELCLCSELHRRNKETSSCKPTA